MNAQEIRQILDTIEFPGYRFHVGGQDRHYIQADFEQPCSITGRAEVQLTRKWYVSRSACKNEVVQTALKCVLTSVEHEAREHFKYRGRAIYGPHYDVDALHRICEAGELDYRGKAAEPAAAPAPAAERSYSERLVMRQEIRDFVRPIVRDVVEKFKPELDAIMANGGLFTGTLSSDKDIGLIGHTSIPKLIEFFSSSPNPEKVGTLDIRDGQLTFEGKADESAAVFIDMLIRMHKERSAPTAWAPLSRDEISDLTCMQIGAPWSDDLIDGLVELFAIYERLRAEGKRPFDPASLSDAEAAAYWAGADVAEGGA